MTTKWIRIGSGLILGVVAACSTAALSQASGATSKTETLRYHVTDVSKVLTRADGSVVRRPPFPEPKAGDVLVINSVDYRGDSRRHAASWTASQSRRCAFTDGEPDCSMTVASDLRATYPGHHFDQERLGDYVYAAASRRYGIGVWLDARNAAVCPALQRWRAQALVAGKDVFPAPSPLTDCPAAFGNTDVWSATTSPNGQP